MRLLVNGEVIRRCKGKAPSVHITFHLFVTVDNVNSSFNSSLEKANKKLTEETKCPVVD